MKNEKGEKEIPYREGLPHFTSGFPRKTKNLTVKEIGQSLVFSTWLLKEHRPLK